MKPLVVGHWGATPGQNIAGPGLKKLFMQFSFPGGISSHVAPTTPESIHEGGELGYSLSHAFWGRIRQSGSDNGLRHREMVKRKRARSPWQSNKFHDRTYVTLPRGRCSVRPTEVMKRLKCVLDPNGKNGDRSVPTHGILRLC